MKRPHLPKVSKDTWRSIGTVIGTVVLMAGFLGSGAALMPVLRIPNWAAFLVGSGAGVLLAVILGSYDDENSPLTPDPEDESATEGVVEPR